MADGDHPHWTAKPITATAPAPADCDTCAHAETSDTVSCDACGAVAAATGERWTLHIPKQAPSAPRASSRTIPITPAPIAQPAPASQAGGAQSASVGDTRDTLWPSLLAVAGIAFAAGISFGFLIANLRVPQ